MVNCRFAVLALLILSGWCAYLAAADAPSNAQVRTAQELLAKKGYDPGPLDGLLGSRTVEALTRFQRDNGLPESGRLDAPTLRALGASGTGAWPRKMSWEGLPDWMYLIMLASLAYVGLIGVRAFALIRQRLGSHREGATLLAAGIVIFSLFALFAGGGGPLLLIGFVLMVAVVGLGAMILAALNAGRMLHRGGGRAVLAVALVIASAAFNILPHPAGAIVLVVFMALTSWQGYYDRFDSLRGAYQQVPALGYLLVWPPMVFLLTLSDLALLPFFLPEPFYGIGVTVLTVGSVVSGYTSA